MRTEPRWSGWVSVLHRKNSFIGIHRGLPTRAENKHQGRAKESALPIVTVSTDVADKAAFVKRGCAGGGGSVHLGLMIQKPGATLYSTMRPPPMPATPWWLMSCHYPFVNWAKRKGLEDSQRKVYLHLCRAAFRTHEPHGCWSPLSLWVESLSAQ